MNITTAPKTKAALTEDGIPTGMLVTLHDAIAFDASGNQRVIRQGSLITQALSGGFDGRVNANVARHKIGSEDISFKA